MGGQAAEHTTTRQTHHVLPQTTAENVTVWMAQGTASDFSVLDGNAFDDGTLVWSLQQENTPFSL